MNVPKPLYRYNTLGGTLGGPVPRIPKVNADGREKLFFFYSVDYTKFHDVQPIRRYTMPTALERAGDFSQTRSHPAHWSSSTTRRPGVRFPTTRFRPIESIRAAWRYLDVFPLPNTVGNPDYNYIMQEPSIPHPRLQHIFRGDVRPTIKDSISVGSRTWYARSVGFGVADGALLSPWGPIRTRYDFDVTQAKVDYTRVLNSTTIFEFSFGMFHSYEDGPPENDSELLKIQRVNYPGLLGLPQFAPSNNPLGVIPKATFGSLQSSANLALGGTPSVGYDNRFPLTGDDFAYNNSFSVTHTRGDHIFKVGLMSEYEGFGQARASIFGGAFNFANDVADPGTTGYTYANAVLGHARDYTESLGKPPDDRRH